MSLVSKEESLDYHCQGRKGKVEVIPTKPCFNQKHLSMAYTPGVAEACRAISADPAEVFEMTSRGNLVAVISNGTAVLGLGDIGPLAGKPVMEGKGVLFKIFADVDVFDLELATQNTDQLIECVKMLEPTFGGINLEDIKAPECFEIERRLIKEMNIPVFHDDQHGTAIISGAGLLNALEITGKSIADIVVVVLGAGAGAIACAKFYESLGVGRENIRMYDSRGLLHQGRTDLNEYKRYFAQAKDLGPIEQGLKGADCFLGLAVAGLVEPVMLKSMAKDPIIFACANPDPEIPYDLAKAARPDCIMATGRSDFPNQINNVLGFPFIFRGALDVRARAINEEMKIAAARSLAALAREAVPAEVLEAYNMKSLSFGPDYIIPKPFDTRVLEWEAPAVAKAAMDSGVAGKKLDLSSYPGQLRQRLASTRQRIALALGNNS